MKTKMFKVVAIVMAVMILAGILTVSAGAVKGTDRGAKAGTVSYGFKTIQIGTKRPMVSNVSTAVKASVAVNKKIPQITKFDSVDEGVKINFSKVSGVRRYAVYCKSRGRWVRIGTSTTGKYIHKGTKSGTRYQYTVRGVSNNARSFKTNFYKTGWYYTYNMRTPKVTKLSSSSKGVNLTWGAVPNAKRYRVYYRGSRGWTYLGSTTKTSYTDSKVSYGSSYTYTVRCANYKNNRFTSSFNGRGWKYTHYLPTPSGFNYDCVNGGIKLSWSKVSGAAKYRVFYYGSKGWTKMADVSGTSYTDYDVREGKSYTYVVRCVSSNGKKYTSNLKSGGWSARLLTTPSGMTITSTSSGNELSWNAVDGAGAYKVFYKSGNSWKGISNVTDTKFVDTDVINGQVKTYTVRCVTADGKWWRSGFNETGWSKVYDYNAVETEEPTSVGATSNVEDSTKVNLLNTGSGDGLVEATEPATEAPTEAPTVKPTEAPLTAPTGVTVGMVSEGKKEYAKVVKYGYCSNLMSSGVWVNVGETPNSFWKAQVENDRWVDTSLECLENGKVRFHFTPVAPNKVTSIITIVRWGDGDKDFSRVDVSGDSLKRGYCDHQLPKVSSVNPSVKVSWGSSSNADGYDVTIKNASGKAASQTVHVGKNATSATISLNTADSGSYTAEVKAIKGTQSKSATRSFSLKSDFVAESEASTIKVPVVFPNTRFVCNRCGRNVSGKVKDHIIPIDSTELRERYADSLYTYKYKPTAGTNNAWVAAWAGTPDVTLTAGYYDLGDFFYHPLNASDPDLLVNCIWEDSLERSVSIPSNFSLAELQEKINNCGIQNFIDAGSEYWLNCQMSTFHRDIEGCTSAYHSESCVSISGLQTVVIPATGYTRVTVG